MTLQQIIAELATDAKKLDDNALSLLWGAFEGDETFAQALAGDQIAPEAESAQTPTTPVWLSSISVEGFRGIGPRVELLLSPQPGLTLVVGRNGSGKSSFAEGLEALLTGDNLRWQGRPKVWQEGWRNLHHTDSINVGAELNLEGDNGPTELTRSWGDDFDESTVTGNRDGNSIGLSDLGWSEALANYKPFLSYNELGSMLEQSPSAIYDSMAAVLGLDQITEARERLRQARLDSEKPGKETAKARKQLVADLANADSPRAADAHAVLSARTPDLAQLDALAFGDDVGGPNQLVVLSQLPELDSERLHQLRSALAEAVDQRQSVADTDVSRSGRLATLLRQALDHHDHEGDGACPVCGQGNLDDGWRTRAATEADELEHSAAALRSAEQALGSARREAEAALTAPPPVLLATSPVEPFQGAGGETIDLNADLQAVGARWNEWVAPPTDGWTDDALLARLADVDDINEVIGGLRAVATRALVAQDEDWRPMARRITSWVESARAAADASALGKRLGVVEDFYKDAEATIRAERFQPIAERSSELWTQLRQQSNVNLERVALEGRTTQRRVELDVTVDGTATSALGVMSQGELHALALALFLPRVTAAESPFRFLVVDDPVQAMDPARVEGLAGVLASVAADRQVIVFTHDDRLPTACRRLQLDAEIVEISRQTGSRVTTAVSASPAEKSIGDAYALASTQRLPVSLKRQIVPIHCRRALEAQARDLAWPRLLAAGRSHSEIDELITEADTTTQLLALLFFGEVRNPDDVYQRLDGIHQGSGGQLRFLNKSVHEPPDDLNPEALTGTVRNLMTALREWAS